MDGDHRARLEAARKESQKTWRTATRAVRGGLKRSNFEETSEALFLTSGYV